MQRSTARRALARTTLAGTAAALAVLASAGPAAAHVTIAAPNTVAGSYTLLTVSVPHGCDGDATTAIAVQIPEPINAVTPSVNPNWDVEKVMVDLPEPVIDAHGNEVTERVDQIVYTAKTPLPDDLRDAFELSLRLPEETAGQTLYFPVVQTCTASDHPWIEIPADGQNPDELESPAPSITVTTAKTADDTAEEAADTDGDDTPTRTTPGPTRSPWSPSPSACSAPRSPRSPSSADPPLMRDRIPRTHARAGDPARPGGALSSRSHPPPRRRRTPPSSRPIRPSAPPSILHPRRSPSPSTSPSNPWPTRCSWSTATAPSKPSPRPPATPTSSSTCPTSPTAPTT